MPEDNGYKPSAAQVFGFLVIVRDEESFGALSHLGVPALHPGQPVGVRGEDVLGVPDLYLVGGGSWAAAVARRLRQLGYLGRAWELALPREWAPDAEARASQVQYQIRQARRLELGGQDANIPKGKEYWHPDPPEKPAPEPIIVTLSSVTSEPVSWLWPGWLPADTLCLLDGDPGLGKSSLTLDWAARLSRGWPMPPAAGGTAVRDPAAVLLLGAEDVLKHTVRPRLDAAGADPELVHSLEGFRVGESVREPILPDDLARLEGFIRERGVRLVVVDPFLAFLGGEYDAHRDQDVRRCMFPLRQLAERLGVTVLLLRHLNKLSGGAALYRGGGSIGITGAVRAALLVGRDPDDPSRHVLAMNKINVGPLPRSLAFTLDPKDNVTRIGWCGECDLGRDDILWHATAKPPDARERGRPDEQAQAARRLLLDMLRGGPRSVTDIKQAADASALAWRTVNRAKRDLGIASRQTAAGWSWSLPHPGEGGQDANNPDPDELWTPDPPEYDPDKDPFAS